MVRGRPPTCRRAEWAEQVWSLFSSLPWGLWLPASRGPITPGLEVGLPSLGLMAAAVKRGLAY